MSMLGAGAVVLMAVAVLAVVGFVIAVLARRGRNDWGGPPQPPQAGPTGQDTGRTSYGTGAPDYPTSPPPAVPASNAEIDVPDGPAPSAPVPPPQPVGDHDVVREQHRLDQGGPDQGGADQDRPDHDRHGTEDDTRA